MEGVFNEHNHPDDNIHVNANHRNKHNIIHHHLQKSRLEQKLRKANPS